MDISDIITASVKNAPVADFSVLDTLDGMKRYIIQLTSQVQQLSDQLASLK